MKIASFFKKLFFKAQPLAPKQAAQSETGSNNSKSTSKGVDNTDKINKILVALAQLFQPFKEVILNVFPSSKKFIKGLDKLGRAISRLVLGVAAGIPVIIHFLKGRFFKYLIVFIILILLLNGVISRLFDTKTYKVMIANAISSSLGYKTVIEGNISINFLSLGVTIENAEFALPESTNQGFYLSKLDVDKLNIKFAYLPAFLGKLKVKQVNLTKANVIYHASTTTNDNNEGLPDFTALKNNLDNLTNFKVEPLTNNIPGNLAKTPNYIESLNNSNPYNDASLAEGNRLTKDNPEKYLNLNGIFNKKFSSRMAYAPVNSSSIFYHMFKGLINNISFNFKEVKNLAFNNMNLYVLNANDEPIINFNNMSGLFSRNIFGGNTFKGRGDLFNKAIYFKFNNRDQKNNGNFYLNLSYSDPALESQDIRVLGVSSKAGNVSGSITANGIAVQNIISPYLFNAAGADLSNSSFSAQFSYSGSLFKMQNIKLAKEQKIDTGSLTFRFGKDSIVDISLTLQVDQLNDIVKNFIAMKNNQYSDSDNFSAFNNMLIAWRNNKSNFLNAKIINLNLNFPDSKLNDLPVTNFTASAFLTKDALYIDKLALEAPNLSIESAGKINLMAENGMFLINTNGMLNSACAYFNCSLNFLNFLNAIAKNKPETDLEAKAFLNSNRIVFNNITGNIGSREINKANVTLINRNDNADILISANFDSLNFEDLKNIYNFKQQTSNLYYSDKDTFTGLPNNLVVHLNINSNKFYYKTLQFNNLETDISLVSSGILVNSFTVYTPDNSGNINGSFNFNNKVTPALLGNINFNNVVLDVSLLNNFLFTNYNLVGKIIVNGNINIAGDDYYAGINRVDGELSLIDYARAKTNRNSDAKGFYMTLSKDSNKKVFSIADLFSTLSINNNIINFNPVVIRYLNGKEDYRGNFSGTYNFMEDNFALKGALKASDNDNKILNFVFNGGLENARATSSK